MDRVSRTHAHIMIEMHRQTSHGYTPEWKAWYCGNRFPPVDSRRGTTIVSTSVGDTVVHHVWDEKQVEKQMKPFEFEWTDSKSVSCDTIQSFHDGMLADGG